MKKVYANSMEVACEAGAGKVIAAFPDVCLSPPPAPTGPAPVPYPNSSCSRDMKAGSKRVRIGGKPVMLSNKSYYASSPLGDEAATKNFGGSLLSHTITGKTYFGAWSMDVKIEGEGVCRHLDITTSNHASYPGSTPPWPNTSSMNLVKVAQADLAKGKCPCCGKAKHATGAPMGRDDWYLDNIDKTAEQRGWSKAQQRAEKRAYRQLITDAMARKGCMCKEETKLLPSPPCDVFFGRQPKGSEARTVQKKQIDMAWKRFRPRFQRQQKLPPLDVHKRQLEKQFGRAPTEVEVNAARQTNHLTPKSAGGCPTGKGNLQLHSKLCASCQAIDERFNRFQ